jgi:hypothetical protein
MYRRTAHEPLVARIRGLAELAHAWRAQGTGLLDYPELLLARCGWP